MTAFDPSYRDDPRYQRKLQRIIAGGDEYAGLVKAFMTDAAGRHMDKMIQLAGYGAQERRGKAALDMGTKRLDVMSDIRSKNIESRDKRAARSADISEKALALNTDRAGRNLDIREEDFDYRQDQLPWANAIAAAGIPIQFALGRRESKEREELRRLRDNMYDPNMRVARALPNYESTYGER